MTFLWEPFSKHFDDEKQILAYLIHQEYVFPYGWKFDARINDIGEDPLEADKTLSTYNLPYKCNRLLTYVIEEQEKRKTKHNALIVAGDDFAFMNTRLQYKTLDAIMTGCNELHGKKFNLEYIYSTP
jgi:hypothetical protein